MDIDIKTGDIIRFTRTWNTAKATVEGEAARSTAGRVTCVGIEVTVNGALHHTVSDLIIVKRAVPAPPPKNALLRDVNGDVWEVYDRAFLRCLTRDTPTRVWENVHDVYGPFEVFTRKS